MGFSIGLNGKPPMGTPGLTDEIAGTWEPSRHRRRVQTARQPDADDRAVPERQNQ